MTRICAVQMAPHLGAQIRNGELVAAEIVAGARDGAELVVFPEAALTGYVFESLRRSPRVGGGRRGSGPRARGRSLSRRLDPRRVRGHRAGRSPSVQLGVRARAGRRDRTQPEGPHTLPRGRSVHPSGGRARTGLRAAVRDHRRPHLLRRELPGDRSHPAAARRAAPHPPHELAATRHEDRGVAGPGVREPLLLRRGEPRGQRAGRRVQRAEPRGGSGWADDHGGRIGRRPVRLRGGPSLRRRDPRGRRPR